METAKQQDTRELISIGDEVVVFDYTNTTAKDFGFVIGLTEHHVQLRQGWHGSSWYPLTNVSKVRRTH